MSAESEPLPPIYVDLDGTLIATDMVWESICLLLRHRPLTALRLPLWVASGRAGFKRRLAEHVASDPATLPYRREVLDYLAAERARGREIVLATASHSSVARPIADHLELFSDVLASTDGRNLKGAAKLEHIEAHAAARPFEYLGNSSADLPIWQRAQQAVLVAPTRGASRGAGALDVPTREIPTQNAGWRAAWRALRTHQWSKNVLIFVALLLAHEATDPRRLAATVIAFACFSAIASATYLLNDLLDIEADRLHPRKRRRPFAAGTLSIPTGFAMMAGLLVVGLGASLAFLSVEATGMLALYLVGTTTYSFFFKEKLFLDVLVLAGLYTVRVLTGAVAAEVPVSTWLLAFSTFFFLSLALIKRYGELLEAESYDRENLARRSYQVSDLSLVETLGVTSGYLSVLILCLYVSNDDVSRLYSQPRLLWLISPVMLYWISRMWFLARRGDVRDDPVLFAIRDRTSFVLVALMAAVVLLAAL